MSSIVNRTWLRQLKDAETPVLWPPHAKSWLLEDSDAGRDWGQENKGTTEDEMAGWHHWLDGHESEWVRKMAFVASIHPLNTSYMLSVKLGFLLPTGDTNIAGTVTIVEALLPNLTTQLFLFLSLWILCFGTVQLTTAARPLIDFWNLTFVFCFLLSSLMVQHY